MLFLNLTMTFLLQKFYNVKNLERTILLQLLVCNFVWRLLHLPDICTCWFPHLLCNQLLYRHKLSFTLPMQLIIGYASFVDFCTRHTMITEYTCADFCNSTSFIFYFLEFVDEEGVRWTVEKCRPNVSLMNFYNISWKPRNNHFNRHTDIKPKGVYKI